MTLTKSPSGVWHAAFRGADGRTKTITTRCTDKAQAQQVVKESKLPQLEMLARADRVTHDAVCRLTAGRKVTVQSAFEQWSDWLAKHARSPRTAQNSHECVKLWLTQTGCAAKPTTSVRHEDIDSWINQAESKAKAATRKWKLCCLSVFFKYCQTQNWVLKNPVETVRVNYNHLSHRQKETQPKALFTLAEAGALLAGILLDQARIDKEIARLTAAQAHPNCFEPLYAQSQRLIFWQFAVQISWDIGLRLGDICQLEWACFDYPGMATVWTDKRNRRVHVPISLQVSEALTAIPVSDARYLFPEERRLILDGSKRSTLSLQFTRLCARHGIKGKSFHSIRHTRITREAERLGRKGMSYDEILQQIAREVGHSQTSTTKGYVH